MRVSTTSIGRAGTVLVFGEGSNAKAVISSVIAHTTDGTECERIRFAGPVGFDESTIHHVQDILIPIVDKITDSLGLTKKSFEVSVVNPGAVSVSDLGVEITGFSADVPMFLALVSAALNMAIPNEAISTGHIASSDGDIAAVKAIPTKISAACDEKTICHFIYPALDKDRSLTVLSPVEHDNMEAAVISAKGPLEMTAVNDIADLIRAVFTEEAIVSASLEKGFFGIDGSDQPGGNPISALVRFLAGDNENRFWIVLERYFHTGEIESAKRLLLAYSQFHTRRKTYPKEFGHKLILLLRSLPPGMRKNRINFPVLPTLECVNLTQFATETDTGDIGLLYDAAEGKAIWIEPTAAQKPKAASDASEDNKDQALVYSITSQIDSSALAKVIGVPIDTARATYILRSLTVKTNEEFHDTITAFYLHLQRHVHSVSESVDMNTVRDDAVALLERTFADKGGVTAAMNEAYSAISGGMKFVLDAMTERFRTECQTKHVNRIIQEALGPLNRDAQVSFISALLERLSAHLPEEITTAPPERFVEHHEIIIKEYVRSLDKINEVFRKF